MTHAHTGSYGSEQENDAWQKLQDDEKKSMAKERFRDSRWYDNKDSRVGLALWLWHYFEGEWINYLRVIDEPWHYDREYSLWKLWQEAGSDDERERCVELVNND